jgi:CheY-like chemotaxis protein
LAEQDRIRVLLADDNSDFADGVRAWLGSDCRFEIVATVDCAAAAIDAVGRLDPDLVLLDVTMLDLNGFEATRRIKRRTPAPLVVLMSLVDSRALRAMAAKAGADGFIAEGEITIGLMPLLERLMGLGEAARPGGGLRRPKRDVGSLVSKQGPRTDLSE